MKNNTETDPANTTCPAFEEWWKENGVKTNPPVLENAYKELTFKGWVAAAEKCAIVCEFWGKESNSVIRTTFLPKDTTSLPKVSNKPSEETIALQTELSRVKRIAIYLADCHAATLEWLPKKTSKKERERQQSICQKAADMLENKEMHRNTFSNGISEEERINKAIKRCRVAIINHTEPSKP